ncbi:hypothetical protein F8S13_12075 [Chloroflexia bacterium SDU3-3]|nr:hypothetical protein F8S13_12075 [Chloroflexia bacterium SDU3-3]
MHIAILIGHTILCILGVLGSFFLTTGSVISIANMQVPWAPALLVAALGVPVVFVGAGILAWVANSLWGQALTIGVIAFPWIYLALFVLAMLVTFRVQA